MCSILELELMLIDSRGLNCGVGLRHDGARLSYKVTTPMSKLVHSPNEYNESGDQKSVT